MPDCSLPNRCDACRVPSGYSSISFQPRKSVLSIQLWCHIVSEFRDHSYLTPQKVNLLWGPFSFRSNSKSLTSAPLKMVTDRFNAITRSAIREKFPVLKPLLKSELGCAVLYNSLQ